MIISREVKILVFIILSLIFSSISISHEGRDHSEKKQEIILPVAENTDVIQIINKDYIEKIKPIFKKSCFNCHSMQIQYPWYYQIPGIKQWIDHDTREAIKHIDMTNDFPFRGHGNPLKDLEAISKTIEKETMPPLRYLFMHGDARLTEAQKKAVLEWIKESRDKLILEQ